MSKKYYFEKGSLDTIGLTDFLKKYGLELHKETQGQRYEKRISKEFVNFIETSVVYANLDTLGYTEKIEFISIYSNDFDDCDCSKIQVTLSYNIDANKKAKYNYLLQELYQTLYKQKPNNYGEINRKEERIIKNCYVINDEISVFSEHHRIDEIINVFMDLFKKYFN